MENANGVIKKLTSAERSYYTAAEVREMMGVSRDTAYRMIRSLRSDLIADGQLAKNFEVCTSSPGKHDSLQYAFK